MFNINKDVNANVNDVALVARYFIVNFKHISHLFLLFLYLALSSILDV